MGIISTLAIFLAVQDRQKLIKYHKNRLNHTSPNPSLLKIQNIQMLPTKLRIVRVIGRDNHQALSGVG